MFRQSPALLLLLFAVVGSASGQAEGPLYLDHRPGEDTSVVDVAEFSANYPKKAIEEYEQAVSDARRGNRASALMHLEEALSIFPDFYAARNALGIVYQRMGRFRDGEREFKLAADLNPRSVAPLLNLGGLFIEEAESNPGQYASRTLLNDALGNLQTALRLQPASPLGHYLTGLVYYKTAFYEEAEDHFERALDGGPNMSFVNLALANVYIHLQEWDSVLARLDTYLRENRFAANRDEVRQVRARIVEKLGDEKE